MTYSMEAVRRIERAARWRREPQRKLTRREKLHVARGVLALFVSGLIVWAMVLWIVAKLWLFMRGI